MRVRVVFAALALAAVSSSAVAQDGGWIMDPENPGLDAEEPADDGGWIMDPENPGFDGGDVDDGGGWIMDPENPGAGDEEAPSTPPPPTESRFVPSGSFRGEFASNAAFDLRSDSDGEDIAELAQQLTMRTRFRFAPAWSATLEGRAAWITTAPSADEDPDTTWQGRFEPDLRAAYVSGVTDRWLIRIGMQGIVWGSSDLLRPADFVNPVDLRRGFFADRDEARIPVFAFDATAILDQLAVQFLVIPFFVPNRVDVYGSDTALLRSSGGLGGAFPIGDLATSLFDPSLEEQAQPLLIQTELPDETPENVSAGLRLTSSYGGWDISAGYLYAFDRFPYVRIDEGLRSCLDLVSGFGLDPAEFGVSDLLDTLPVLEAACPDLFAALDAGTPLIESTYERASFLEVDAVTYLGKIGLRAESALQLERTLYREDFTTERHPVVTSTLGVSYESGTGDLVVTIEGFHQHAFVAEDEVPDDAPGFALFAEDMVGVAGGLQLRFDAFEGLAGTRAGDLGLQLGGTWMAFVDDVILAPSVSWDPTDRWTVAAGVSVFTGLADEESSLGDLYEANDAAWVRVEAKF